MAQTTSSPYQWNKFRFWVIFTLVALLLLVTIAGIIKKESDEPFYEQCLKDGALVGTINGKVACVNVLYTREAYRQNMLKK